MDDLFEIVALCAIGLAAPACAASIEPAGAADGGADGDAGPAGPVTTTANPDGTFTTRVDASADDAWVRLDLDGGAAADASWDLAAQRFHLMLDGGVSGGGGVEVAAVPGALGDVTVAPATGWITDAADGDDADALPDLAFEQGDGWYGYDPATHVLTPRPLVWVVRTTAGATIALAIESYYDDAGTSGHFRLRWAPLGGGA